MAFTARDKRDLNEIFKKVAQLVGYRFDGFETGVEVGDEMVAGLQGWIRGTNGLSGEGQLQDGNVTLSLAPSGVTAGVYANPSQVRVDALGRIVSIAEGSTSSSLWWSPVDRVEQASLAMPNNTAAGLFTFGGSLLITKARSIYGIRMRRSGPSASAAMRFRLWGPDGTSLAMVESTVGQETKSAYFAAPYSVSGSLLGRVLTYSAAELDGGGGYCYAALDPYTLATPALIAEGVFLIHPALADMGDARPTSPQVGGYYALEPILEAP